MEQALTRDAARMLNSATRAGLGDRRVHPLKAWRLSQLVDEPRCRRTMRVADAARTAGVPYQTWDAWEKYEDEAGHRKPDAENMRRIFFVTRGAIRPNDFYPVKEWRVRLQAEAQAAEAAPAEVQGEDEDV